MEKDTDKFLQVCDAQMELLASRGIITAVARQDAGNDSITYRFKWHMGRVFELIADGKNLRLVFPSILPMVDKRSKLDADLRRFVRSLSGFGVEKHRRLVQDHKHARLTNRKGTLSLSVRSEHENYTDFVANVIGVAHQIYTLFLREGGYDEYLVDAFGIEPDTYL